MDLEQKAIKRIQAAWVLPKIFQFPKEEEVEDE